MFRQIPVCLVSSCLLLLLSFRHPYHMAVTTIQLDTEHKTAAIEIKFFYHDLEPALNQFAGTDIDIKNHGNPIQRDSLVYAYTQHHFGVKANGRQVPVTPGTISFKDEYIFIGLSCKPIEGNTFAVSNTMCYETEPTQTNIFHFIRGGQKITRKCVNPQSETTFSF